MVPVILYEDNHLLAVQKPFGMPSQPDETGDLSLTQWVEQYLREAYQKPGNVFVGLLHRLDRPAGGIVLLAKTSKAAERMSKAFQQRSIEKKYLVVTEGVPQPPAARLQHFVAPVPGQENIMRAHDAPAADRKPATLAYTVLRTAGGRALLEVELETGRKHQIRVQLAKIGCGVVGDLRYHRTQPLADRSIALLAWRLSFEHPVRKGERISLRAQVPTGGPWEIAAGI